MSAPFLPSPSSSTLLVIDVQERLLPAIPSDEQGAIVKHVSNLVSLYGDFAGDVAFTEQYPRGLGPTVAPLATLLSALPPERPARRLEKVAFSACQADGFDLLGVRQDVVLVGMEAHVCVLLTGLDLLQRGHRVFLPFDAVASRRPAARDNGLALLRQAGATVINTETLVFATLHKAGGDAFKKFSALIR